VTVDGPIARNLTGDEPPVALLRRSGNEHVSPHSCFLGSQEDREPTMQCVAALRYAVQFESLLADHAFADALEVGALLASLSSPLATPAKERIINIYVYIIYIYMYMCVSR
jgi:hypothetical protein